MLELYICLMFLVLCILLRISPDSSGDPTPKLIHSLLGLPSNVEEARGFHDSNIRCPPYLVQMMKVVRTRQPGDVGEVKISLNIAEHVSLNLGHLSETYVNITSSIQASVGHLNTCLSGPFSYFDVSVATKHLLSVLAFLEVVGGSEKVIVSEFYKELTACMQRAVSGLRFVLQRRLASKQVDGIVNEEKNEEFRKLGSRLVDEYKQQVDDILSVMLKVQEIEQSQFRGQKSPPVSPTSDEK